MLIAVERSHSPSTIFDDGELFDEIYSEARRLLGVFITTSERKYEVEVFSDGRRSAEEL